MMPLIRGSSARRSINSSFNEEIQYEMGTAACRRLSIWYGTHDVRFESLEADQGALSARTGALVFHVKIRVLGSAAGGGFPQWNCNCPNYADIRTGTFKGSARDQSSITETRSYATTT